MSSSLKTKRKEERIPSDLPVSLGNAEGVTHNISASGVYFVTNASYLLGNQINFTVEFDSPGGKLMLKCDGEIIRIDSREDGKIGIAVKIIESVMLPSS